MPVRDRRAVASLATLPLLAAVLVGVTLRHPEYNEPFFVYTTYGALAALIAIYSGLRLSLRRQTARAWFSDQLPGVVVSALVAILAVAAIAPGFRVLADEANLVGVSKNLFFHRTANFAVTGKWYFENYWNINETTDRRPALFPFLVSLVHVLRGYRPENAFVVNAGVFALFVFASYRLARSLGGETFGVAAAVLVAASPITLVSARSAGFDLLWTLLLVVVVQSALDHLRDPSPARLALLSLHLCLIAYARYEGWAILLLTALALGLLGRLRRADFRGFGWLYALMPLLLLPRYWQVVAKAKDTEQPLSASLFHVASLGRNAAGYARLLAHPFDLEGPHSPVLLALGAAGCALGAIGVLRRLRAGGRSGPLPPPVERRFVAFLGALLAMETVLCFSYAWGDPTHAASARLFLWFDTVLGFGAAWLLCAMARRLADGRAAMIAVTLACGAIFAMHLPAASEARFVNALILTRQTAQTWRFFESLGDKRILVLSDRPGLFTIMDYGAEDISLADGDRSPLVELSRHLYDDVYLVQEVDLDSGAPRAGFAPWPDVEKTTVFEFQNTDTTSVRIARVKH